MTEKRFMVKPPTLSEDLGIIDYESGEVMISIKEVVECLNNLVDENEQLKEKNQNLRKCINEIYLISSRESVE